MSDDKKLLRLVRLWESLTPEDRQQFCYHTDGSVPIVAENDLVPTSRAAKLLGVSFYKVKKMVESGELVPAEVRMERFAWNQPKVLGYLFNRADLKRTTLAPRAIPITRKKTAWIRRQKGITYREVGESFGITPARGRTLADEGHTYYHRRFRVPVIHALLGDSWSATNCDFDHTGSWHKYESGIDRNEIPFLVERRA